MRVGEAEGRINYDPIEIEIEYYNCFSIIPTNIYFEQRFLIISRRVIKLSTLKRLQGLSCHLKLKLCARAHQS